MDPTFSTKLTSAQIERLAWVAEEMGEAIQIIGKTLRHGIDSPHPKTKETNRQLLIFEIGHVIAALDLLVASDLNAEAVEQSRQAKHIHVKQYLHFQKV